MHRLQGVELVKKEKTLKVDSHWMNIWIDSNEHSPFVHEVIHCKLAPQPTLNNNYYILTWNELIIIKEEEEKTVPVHSLFFIFTQQKCDLWTTIKHGK